MVSLGAGERRITYDARGLAEPFAEIPKISTIAGNGNGAYDGDGGPATSASVNGPIGMAEDDAGNIYINESNSSAIRQIGSDGIITTVAGLTAPTGSSRAGGFNGDGSPATKLQVNKPIGMATSAASCSVLLADTSNQRLRQVSAGVSFAVATIPPGQQVTVDGQAHQLRQITGYDSALDNRPYQSRHRVSWTRFSSKKKA